MYRVTLFALVLLTSCMGGYFDVSGNGNVVAEKREVGEFIQVSLQGSYELILTESQEASLEVETDENLQEYIVTHMEGNTLVIETTANIHSQKGIVLNLSYTDLELIDVSGAVDLSNFGTLAGESLTLDLSGAGEIDLRVDVKDLRVHTSGAGQVTLKGEAQRSNVHISGAGGIDGYGLVSSECTVTVSGIGGAEVYVTEKLTATVSGIGGISYKGQPTEVDRSVSGLGSVQAAD